MDDIATSAEAMEAEAIPRCADLRADGRDHAVRVPDALAKRRPSDRSPAEWAYQRVILYLKAFEETLDDSQVIAMAFAGGPAGVLRIQGVGFHAPDLVTFSGMDEAGQMAQVIQHVSQLSLLLRAMKKPADQPVPERIGFRLARALEEAEDARGNADAAS
ncbi:hypothetical protein [Jannaschia rubra]|uniref:hypothetical protein n=1 Tax=Jannaschia rubra TaxID=282197 RepID=UPI002493A0D8|nr:hypothetical protein [Jannaschia rubra]